MGEKQFQSPWRHQNCNTKFSGFLHFSFLFLTFSPHVCSQNILILPDVSPGGILGTLEHIYETSDGFGYPYQMKNHSGPKPFLLESKPSYERRKHNLSMNLDASLPIGHLLKKTVTPRNKGCTIRSNYRQVVLFSTSDFLLLYTLDGLPHLEYTFKEIFHVAPFEKNPNLWFFILPNT